ncbi:MAG: fdrA domain protein [Candidatus Bathyarchaeia archaeon]
MPKKLLGVELKVINLGVKIFYSSLKEQGVKVVHVDWRPPAGGDLEIARLLEKIGYGDK